MSLDESFMSMGILLPEAPSPAGDYRPVVAWAEMGVSGIETAHAIQRPAEQPDLSGANR